MGTRASVGLRSTSVERIEKARRSHRTLLAGEYDTALYTSELVYDQHFGNTGGRYQGEAGMRRGIGQLYEIWSEIRSDLEDPPRDRRRRGCALPR
jgi:hypothetical protein